MISQAQYSLIYDHYDRVDIEDKLMFQGIENMDNMTTKDLRDILACCVEDGEIELRALVMYSPMMV